MRTFKYGHEDSAPLNHADLFKVFNNYRINKYLIEILLHLNKTNLPDYSLLEAGCGNGDKMRFFAELRVKPENCYGIDLSEEAITLCQHLSPAAMNFQVGSVLNMPYLNHQFDLAICSGIFSCFNSDADINKLSDELARVMKDDGILFVIDINENFNAIYSNTSVVTQKSFRSFDGKIDELQTLLKDNFNLIVQMPIFASDNYRAEDGRHMRAVHLYHIERAIDEIGMACAYNLWAFAKKSSSSA